MEELKKYQTGDLIVPGDLVKETGLEMIEIYRKLEAQRKEGIVEIEYVPNCPHCNHLEESGYSTFNSIPHPLHCKQCEKELEDLFRDTLVFYRKL